MASFTATSPILTCVPSALRTFLGRPANLPQISNPDLELEIVKAPLEVLAGEQRATHEYLTTSEILILESQIDGPLRAWQHAQKIEIVTPDSCRLIDEIEFECPGGMLGYLLTEARIKDSLEEGMEFRYSTLQELIESGAIA